MFKNVKNSIGRFKIGVPDSPTLNLDLRLIFLADLVRLVDYSFKWVTSSNITI